MNFLKSSIVFGFLCLSVLGLGKGFHFTDRSSFFERTVAQSRVDCNHPISTLCEGSQKNDDIEFQATEIFKKVISQTLADLSQRDLIRAFQFYLEKKKSLLRYSGKNFEADLAQLGGPSAVQSAFLRHFFPGSSDQSSQAKAFSFKLNQLFFPESLSSCFNGGSLPPLSLEKIFRAQSELANVLLSADEASKILQNLEGACDRLESRKFPGLKKFCNPENLDELRTKVIIATQTGGAAEVDLRADLIKSFLGEISESTASANARSASVCQAIFIPLQKRVMREAHEFLKEILMSKSSVRMIEEFFYARPAFSNLVISFENIKLSVEKFFRSSLVPRAKFSSTKNSLIVRQLRNMSILPLEPETDKAFIQTGVFGQPVLSAVETEVALEDESFKISMDPELTNFVFLNAFYASSFMTEEPRKGPLFEKMVILPSAALLFQRNPGGALLIFTHEVGHKFGPNVSQLNGYDLSQVYAPLLGCLFHRAAVTDAQKDEAIADWISAKVQGGIILRKSNLDERAGALKRFVAPLCTDLERDELYPNSDDVHPTARNRLDGVIGSVPEIRALRGCSAALKCDLDGGVAQ